MKILLFTLLILFPLLGNSSLPLEVSLEQLAKNTDHLLVGRVVGVDMIDPSGNEILDLSARTGPGIGNVIRLIIKVDEVIITNASSVPEVLKVPLDPFMHYTLGQIKEVHRAESIPFLLLLEGEEFVPPFAGTFSRGLSEKESIMKLIKSNNLSQQDAASGAAA